MSLTEADKRVVRAFVNEKPADSRLLDTDGVRLDKMGLGGETVAKWVNGRIAIVSTESAKSDESIIRFISKEAGPGVVDFSYARKGHRVHEHGAMGRNGRGMYHKTGVGKNDIVLYHDHRGRFRADLITSAGGNHITIGPTSGYASLDEAVTEAAREHHNRGLRGGLLWQQSEDGYEMLYRPGPDGKTSRVRDVVDQLLEPNGRRTGILSDGTRVNVYHDDTGSGDPWTVVPHSMEWDKQERGGMRPMLGMSETASGISEWSEGQEGRHLGRSVPWDAVPEGIKRHIERRVAQESNMVANSYSANARGRGARRAVGCTCGAKFGNPHTAACIENATRETGRKSARKPKVESREDRIRREWDEAESKGLVRMVSEPEIENYFDVYGEPDSAEERQEIEERIDRDGVYMYAAQYLSQDTGDWETADSIGMVFGDINGEGYYEFDLKESALKNIYGGHTPNARGTTADANAVRELSLYIDNDYALIGAPNSKGKSIDENLRKKVAAGKYDPKLAPTLWGYLIEDGARKYAKEYSVGTDWAQIFNAATRRQVAEDFARAWEAENIR